MKQQLFDLMFQNSGDVVRKFTVGFFLYNLWKEVAKKPLNVTYGYVHQEKSLCTGQLRSISSKKPIPFKSLKN
jgi:hypothetical protein